MTNETPTHSQLMQRDPVYRRLRDIEDELLALAKEVARLAAERAGSYPPPCQSNHGGT